MTTQMLTKIAILKSVCYQPFMVRDPLSETVNTHGRLLYQ